MRLLVAAKFITLATLVHGARISRDIPLDARSERLTHRATTDATNIAGNHFDFIIVGGGVAGLAIASRLSEWSNITVLVIEAGTDGSTVKDQIYMPGKSYLDGLAGSFYDWQYTTTPQENASDKPRTWPRGKGLGGSGSINGAFFCRGSKEDYDAWDKLQGNDPKNVSWGWATMLKYMMKSETFTPMTDAQESTFSVTHDSSVRGKTGPIQASYSRYQFRILSTWVPTLSSLGLKSNPDPASGLVHGASFVTSTINPKNSSRSDSKAAYIVATGAGSRENLFILTDNQAVRLMWNDTTSGAATVGGVVFAANAGSQERTVYADKEVILAGGVIGSAQLLQLSGVGPKNHLATLKIKSVVDLPGVGQNLQDHLSTTVQFESSSDPTWSSLKDPTFAEEETEKWRKDGSGMWSYVNEATAYPGTMDLFGGTDGVKWAQGVRDRLVDALAATKSMNTMDETVARGVQAQYAVQADTVAAETSGQVELIFTMLGQNVGGVGIQVGLQHPFSRGTVLINSPSAFEPPVINPNYFANSWDKDVMRAGIRFINKIVQTSPLTDQITNPGTPELGADDDVIDKFLSDSIGTEYHPCGTCSMQPLANGGIVNTSLIVYGTTNLRVADASIIPLNIAAHLMATTYGIAEHASDLIKASHAKIEISSSSSSSTTSSNSLPTDATDTSHTTNKLTTGSKVAIGVCAAIAAALIILLLAFMLYRRRNRDKVTLVAVTSDTAVFQKNDGRRASSPTHAPLAPFMGSQRESSVSTGQSSLRNAHPDSEQQVFYDKPTAESRD